MYIHHMCANNSRRNKHPTWNQHTVQSNDASANVEVLFIIIYMLRRFRLFTKHPLRLVSTPFKDRNSRYSEVVGRQQRFDSDCCFANTPPRMTPFNRPTCPNSDRIKQSSQLRRPGRRQCFRQQVRLNEL